MFSLQLTTIKTYFYTKKHLKYKETIIVFVGSCFEEIFIDGSLHTYEKLKVHNTVALRYTVVYFSALNQKSLFNLFKTSSA